MMMPSLQVLQKIGDEHICFVFTLEVDGKAVDPEPPLVPLAGQEQGQRGRGPLRQGALPAAPRPAPPAGAAARLPAAVAAHQPAAQQAPAAVQQPATLAVHMQQAGAAQPAGQQQQQQQCHQASLLARQQQPTLQLGQPAKENSAANKVQPAAGSRLALPSCQKPSAPGPLTRPAVVTAVRQVVIASDSDDDFK